MDKTTEKKSIQGLGKDLSPVRKEEKKERGQKLRPKGGRRGRGCMYLKEVTTDKKQSYSGGEKG